MAGSTVSIYMAAYRTKLQQREKIEEFRTAYGDIDNLNERNIELRKNHTSQIEADVFMLLVCSDPMPIVITTYSPTGAQGALEANDPVEVVIQGVFMWPGKISISINNPSNNPSDLPYKFTAIYS